jgi:hypothetical protein
MVGAVQHRGAHDGLDRVASALEHPRQAAGLALEMKAQRKLVHVNERSIASRRTAFIATLAKMPSRLRQQRHQDADAAIAARRRRRSPRA